MLLVKPALNHLHLRILGANMHNLTLCE